MGAPKENAMNASFRFKRASMTTADALLRVIRRDAEAFREEAEQRPRLSAAERLDRLRQRRPA
jgi:hypothetical protein